MASTKMEDEVILGLDHDCEQRVRFVLKDSPYEELVPLKTALLSGLVSAAVDMEKSHGDVVIPLHLSAFSRSDRVPLQIAKRTLQYVIEYLHLYQEQESERKIKNEEPKKFVKPLISSNLVENGVSQKEADFIECVFTTTRTDGSKIGKRMLITLLCIANYMAILPLVELCAIKIASMIKGQSLEVVKELLRPEAYIESD